MPHTFDDSARASPFVYAIVLTRLDLETVKLFFLSEERKSTITCIYLYYEITLSTRPPGIDVRVTSML